ncbi:DNA-directed RNA polymerase subunit omega [Thermodesulfatator autotrophicus]|uniref:DNA-directed RNA polymerase subunit omega n=1 Tax=Thermodesulfatator autotrophicus TaxID=1795632 RepID=A0A177E7X6_9BACT|nr:DNA-directed RNA polymerase subunit omega [Thermodesulfatator autotrophicus]OAG27888.1 DNA-directed RNA polymerase subunit omega [Thermodesulfatator autotrophicus]
MARVTVEDCLRQEPRRFRLIHLAIRRVKQLRKGAKPLIECDNKEIVCALREIAAGKVTWENIDQLEKETEELSLGDFLDLAKLAEEKTKS